VLVLALQTAGQVARARYFGGMRLIGFLTVILLIVGIAVLVKKLIK
jgi:hypothetical protein